MYISLSLYIYIYKEREKRKDEKRKKEKERKFYYKKLVYVIMEADKSKLESKGLRTRITDDVSSSPRPYAETEKANVQLRHNQAESYPFLCLVFYSSLQFKC